jgi:lysophosphatidate acyltransferase
VTASLHLRVLALLINRNQRSVLPPVRTEGLTAADVGDLAARIREQMLQALREISDPNAPPPPAIPAEFFSDSRTEKDTPVEAPSILKETTPVPSASIGDMTASHPRDVSEERSATPYSEITSEGSVRRSENDTEEEEGMVLVGRPR